MLAYQYHHIIIPVTLLLIISAVVMFLSNWSSSAYFGLSSLDSCDDAVASYAVTDDYDKMSCGGDIDFMLLRLVERWIVQLPRNMMVLRCCIIMWLLTLYDTPATTCKYLGFSDFAVFSSIKWHIWCIITQNCSHDSMAFLKAQLFDAGSKNLSLSVLVFDHGHRLSI